MPESDDTPHVSRSEPFFVGPSTDVARGRKRAACEVLVGYKLDARRLPIKQSRVRGQAIRVRLVCGERDEVGGFGRDKQC